MAPSLRFLLLVRLLPSLEMVTVRQSLEAQQTRRRQDPGMQAASRERRHFWLIRQGRPAAYFVGFRAALLLRGQQGITLELKVRNVSAFCGFLCLRLSL